MVSPRRLQYTVEVSMHINCGKSSSPIIITVWSNCYRIVILADLERELNKVKQSRNKIKVFCLYIKNAAVGGHDQGKLCLKYIETWT